MDWPQPLEWQVLGSTRVHDLLDDNLASATLSDALRAGDCQKRPHPLHNLSFRVYCSLRVPDQMHTLLKEAARRDGVSVNVVVAALVQHINR